MLYYQEMETKVSNNFNGDNLSFINEIQTQWQKEMMLKHGHHSGVIMDATFGTNENKIKNQ